MSLTHGCCSIPAGGTPPQTPSGFRAALLASESKLKLQQGGNHTAAWHNRSLLMLFSLSWLCLVYRLIILSRLSWSCATKFGYTHVCCLSPRPPDCDLPTCWYNQEKKQQQQKKIYTRQSPSWRFQPAFSAMKSYLNPWTDFFSVFLLHMFEIITQILTSS